jgi:hypothetical protein
MEEITIPLREYRSLVIASYVSTQLRELLKQKAQNNDSLYSNEITTLCNLYGIEVEENEGV